MTGVSQGRPYLTATWQGVSLTVAIKVGALEEGTCFIGNKQIGKYMDLEGAGTRDGTVTLHSATIGQSVDSDRIYLRLDCSDISGSHTGMISPENDTQATSVNLIIALLAND